MTTTQVALLSSTSAFVTNHKNDSEKEEEEEEDGLSITIILTPQLIIALIGFILNVGVIIKFWTIKKKHILEYVLFSLAFADAFYCFFSLVGVLLLYLEDQYELEGEKVASFTNQLIWFSIYASIFHVLTISFEQFVGVVFPFKYKELKYELPIKKVLVILWVMTGVLQASIAIYQYKDGIKNGHKLDLEVQKIAGGIIFATNIVLCLTYGVIIFKLLLRKWSRSDSNSNVRSTCYPKDSKTEAQLCVIAFINAVGFVTFTFPIALFPFLKVKNGKELYLAVLCLLMCNSIFNPIIYYSRRHIMECFESDSNSDVRDGLVTMELRQREMDFTTKSRTDSVTLSTF